MKLLLAVDGSGASDHAVAHVVATAGAWREAPEVHLLYVHPPIPIGRVQSHVGHDTLETYHREESLPHLLSAEQALNTAGIEFTRHIHVGEAADVVLHVARELVCDWIVMGNKGHGIIAEAVLGSVAHRVLSLAHCPVLLVK
ncbi:MAG: universal stress protein [Rhodocyclaceae bacterium]|jgi:nucleotide-binding universal stress UspA family protein